MATKTNKCTVEVLLAAGLRLREGASLEPADAPIVRHDSFRLASNLWGLLGSVRRKLEGLKGWDESA